ncbi:hypothetical protein, partial [Streptomyces ardesiacus]
MPRNSEILSEEPPLHRRQRHPTRHHTLLGHHPGPITQLHHRRQRRNRLKLEQLLHRKKQTQLLRPE